LRSSSSEFKGGVIDPLKCRSRVNKFKCLYSQHRIFLAHESGVRKSSLTSHSASSSRPTSTTVITRHPGATGMGPPHVSTPLRNPFSVKQGEAESEGVVLVLMLGPCVQRQCYVTACCAYRPISIRCRQPVRLLSVSSSSSSSIHPPSFLALSSSLFSLSQRTAGPAFSNIQLHSPGGCSR